MPDFLTELMRRNVIRVAISYTVVAWVVAQAFDLAVDSFGAPDWVMKVTLAVLIAGLPVAMILAWAFELTPDGVMKTEDVPISNSITPRTGQKLNRVTVIALILVLSFVAWDKLWRADDAIQNTATEKSVAVLPFADLSELQDQEWFADGLTEEILNALARLPELQVTARTSSFEFKNTNTDISQIAIKLGVAHIVEGSVRRIGDDLRVTAQLIRAHDGFHLWSETYDRNTDDLFDVQADVAESIAATLDVILDDQQRNRMFSSGTRSVPAFEAFLKGKLLFGQAHDRDKTTGISLADANVYFDAALQLDPTFAQAAIMRSDRYTHFLTDGPAPIVGNPEELTADSAYSLLAQNLEIAVRNAPDVRSRVVAEINREFLSSRWHRLPGLIEQLGNLRAEDYPSDVRTIWLHEVLLMSGNFDLDESISRYTLQSDPLNESVWRDIVENKIQRGDFDAATSLINDIRHNLGDNISLREREIQIAVLRDDRDLALRLLQDDSDYSANMGYLRPLRAAITGDNEKALSLIDEIVADNPLQDRTMISVFFTMGDRERLSALVRDIDASTLGNAVLGVELAFNGGVLMFDLNDTPNFKARLAEAQVDPSQFKPGEWPD